MLFTLRADDPLQKLTPEERRELELKRRDLNSAGFKALDAASYADAQKAFEAALAIARRVYPKTDFPYGHANLAQSVNSLASLYRTQGKYADAEPLAREYLDMQKRLSKGDDPGMATALNNLALVYYFQGKYAEAQPLVRDALVIQKRLYMGDHPELAKNIDNLASMYQAQGKYAEAEPLAREALDMVKRLFAGDHPDVANSLNALALLYANQGKYAESEPLARDALDMLVRLHPKRDHPDVAIYLGNLAMQLLVQGKHADAKPLFHDALGMYRRLIRSFAAQKAEGDALTLVASLPLALDGFLSNARKSKSDPLTVYTELWGWKGVVAQVYEQRQQAARAATSDPRAATLLAELTDARRRRAELLLAPVAKDPANRNERESEINDFERTITKLDEAIRPLLPSVARAEKLAPPPPVICRRCFRSTPRSWISSAIRISSTTRTSQVKSAISGPSGTWHSW